jgi:hypothetical protein
MDGAGKANPPAFAPIATVIIYAGRAHAAGFPRRDAAGWRDRLAVRIVAGHLGNLTVGRLFVRVGHGDAFRELPRRPVCRQGKAPVQRRLIAASGENAACG